MKIWQRYLFSKLIKTFTFLLFCFFLIYLLVDFSVHGTQFLTAKNGTFSQIVFYYLYTFSAHLELFCSLVFLLTLLRTLFDLNHSHELIALHMAGLSKKRILAPFFALAAALALTSYLNLQYISPYAQEMAGNFRKICKNKQVQQQPLHSIYLSDDSELIYQKKGKNELFDLFWIRSSNDIWHMKSLSLSKQLQGRYIDHFYRNEIGQLEKIESFPYRDFPEIPWDNISIDHPYISLQNRPLSLLLYQALNSSTERSGIKTHLFYKLIIPLTPFIILLSLASTCIQFSRKKPLFLITSLSLFALISLKVILDGMLILGENQVLSPAIAILGPFILISGFSLTSFRKVK